MTQKDYYGFPKRMCDLLPPGKEGTAEVTHFVISNEEAGIHNLRCAMQPRMGRTHMVEPGTYVRLTIGGQLFMSDTQMERRTSYAAVQAARGRVLVGGLGVGMVAHALADKPDVKEILILENDPDVIKLVQPSLPARVSVLEADVYTYRSMRSFDFIFFDIWPNFAPDQIKKDSVKLRRRYKPYLAPGGEMMSWTLSKSYKKPSMLGEVGSGGGVDLLPSHEHPSDSGA